MSTENKRFGKYSTLITAIGGLLLFVGSILAINVYFTGQLAGMSTDVARVGASQTSISTVKSGINEYLYSLNQATNASQAREKLISLKAATANDINALESELGILSGAVSPGSPAEAARKQYEKMKGDWATIESEISRITSTSGAQIPAEPATGNTGVEQVIDDKATQPKIDSGNENAGAESTAPSTVANSAIEFTQFSRLDSLSQGLASMIDAVSAESQRVSQRTKILQFVGLAMSVLMFLFVAFHFLGNLRGEDQAVLLARRETEVILDTVSEGLFLLDEDLVIGSEVSKTLTKMFRRDDFEDTKFEDLMREVVTEKVLSTAMDYVRLLWSDRVNENLVKTLNPLNEVQINFDDGSGSFETSHLEFDFNRVKKDGVLSHLLVTVTDITKRVELAQELEHAQAESQAQLNLLLSILHVDPRTLASFLTGADSNMKSINQTLKDPARSREAFQNKLNTIFAMVHSVKGDAAAIGLTTIEERAHIFEELLVELRERPNLTGNDFLPLTVRLDDLMGHLTSVNSMVERLLDFRVTTRESMMDSTDASAEYQQVNPVEATAENHHAEIAATRVIPPSDINESTKRGELPVSEGTVRISSLADRLAVDAHKAESEVGHAAGNDLESALQNLVAKVAQNQGKQANLKIFGLANTDIPPQIEQAVRDIAIQMVRNAVSHGIETAPQRQLAGKDNTGQIKLKIVNKDGNILLSVEDDGAGINENKVKAIALERGLVSVDDIDKLTTAECHRLIFKPGFSTKSEADADAGRGVGLDLVRRRVKEAQGRMKLVSNPGEGTKFLFAIPSPAMAAAAV